MAGAYDSDWKRVRLAVLDRDGWTCQIQGPNCKIHATDADHIIPLGEGGARLDPTNLRASCGPCNYGRVSRRRKQLLDYAIVRSSATPTPSRQW